MKLKQLAKVIDLLKSNETKLDILYHEGVDLINFQDDLYKIINILFTEIFGKEGSDLIDWWIFEDVKKEIYYGEETINVESIEDFHKYLMDLYYKGDQYANNYNR